MFAQVCCTYWLRTRYSHNPQILSLVKDTENKNKEIIIDAKSKKQKAVIESEGQRDKMIKEAEVRLLPHLAHSSPASHRERERPSERAKETARKTSSERVRVTPAWPCCTG